MIGIAQRQHGVVTRRQLLQVGYSPTGVTKLVSDGHLYPVHDGVFVVGRPGLDAHGQLFAAVAACGPWGLVSHRFAGELWGFHQTHAGSPIDVIAPRGKHRERKGVAIHHTRHLPEDDRAEVDRIPVTSVARTLRDLASMLSFRSLRDAFERADQSGLLQLDALFLVLDRSNGHRGAKRLRHLALARATPAPKTRSILEYRFYRLGESDGLARPEVNVVLQGHEVDFLWREAKLVIETDGGEHHSRPADRERDAKRDLDLQLAGFLVLRFSYWEVYDHPEAVVRQVAEILRTRLPHQVAEK